MCYDIIGGECIRLPIKYDKLLALMQKKGITSYTMEKDNIIGQATFKKIKEGGDIDTRTIAKLCALLNCQPGDIMEYVPEKD
jgi:DNA-binding Xre family transcriptional regulator